MTVTESVHCRPSGTGIAGDTRVAANRASISTKGSASEPASVCVTAIVTAIAAIAAVRVPA